MKTIREAFIFINQNISLQEGRAETMARHLLQDLFNVLDLNDERILSDEEWDKLLVAIDQIHRGIPFQYVTGIAHFYGLQFSVNPFVLIPRPETEELVFEISKAITADSRTTLRLLDIGTGSGCIALTLKKNFEKLWIVAIDKSAGAIDVARQNGSRLNVDVDFVIDDILSPKEREVIEGHWHYIVSNPPYIQHCERDKMDAHVLDFEPLDALFPQGADPLQMYECLLDYSFDHLYQGGEFYFELNEYLAKEIKALAEKIGFQSLRIIEDLQGKPRILTGKRNKY